MMRLIVCGSMDNVDEKIEFPFRKTGTDYLFNQSKEWHHLWTKISYTRIQFNVLIDYYIHKNMGRNYSSMSLLH